MTPARAKKWFYFGHFYMTNIFHQSTRIKHQTSWKGCATSSPVKYRNPLLPTSSAVSSNPVLSQKMAATRPSETAHTRHRIVYQPKTSILETADKRPFVLRALVQTSNESRHMYLRTRNPSAQHICQLQQNKFQPLRLKTKFTSHSVRKSCFIIELLTLFRGNR